MLAPQSVGRMTVNIFQSEMTRGAMRRRIVKKHVLLAHVFFFFAQTFIKGCVEMTLYKAYISVKSQQVYAYPDESPWEFEVTATRNEIKVFERLFYQLKFVQSRNFLRAHEPMSVKPYHVDGENDQYDRRLKKVYAWIHEFTSEDSKRFIEQLPYFQRRREVQL